MPRIVKGKVIIGNGGAEYRVRGYVTAYDAETGAQAWRWWTIPGEPAKGFEQPELQDAAKTWNGEWWKLGGGGTVWDGMAYDPELDTLYVGTGNGTPWNQKIRSPGGGDNLYLSSIVALDPETGKYKWHYQTTPGETWDYTATQPIMVADLQYPGRQAPRRDAGAEERLLLCARRQDRETAQRQQVRPAHLGKPRRHDDGPAGGIPRSALRQAQASLAIVALRRLACTTGIRWRSTRRRASSTCR